MFLVKKNSTAPPETSFTEKRIDKRSCIVARDFPYFFLKRQTTCAFLNIGKMVHFELALAASESLNIVIHGRYVALCDLYGEETVRIEIEQELIDSIRDYDTLISDSLPLVHVVCPNEIYINRELKWRAATLSTRLPTTLTIASASAKEFANHMAMEMMMNSTSVNLIMGESMSGKTTILRKIQAELFELSTISWSIYVDLSRLYPNRRSARNINLEDIVERSDITKIGRSLFYSVLEANPKKIVFLFDDMDEMTDERRDKIFPLVVSLIRRGATVVIAGRYYTLDRLKGAMPEVEVNVWELTCMKKEECKEFLGNIWTQRMKSTLNDDGIDADAYCRRRQRLEEYSSAFTEVLTEKTHLIRQPGILLVLGETFYERSSSSSSFIWFEPSLSCVVDFVIHDSSSSSCSSSTSSIIFKNISVNKLKLYEFFYEKLTTYRSDIDDPTGYYGPTALKQLLIEQRGNIAEQMLIPLNRDICKSKKILTTYNEFAIFTNIIDNHIEFLTNDFRDYFAAEFIKSYIEDEEHPIEELNGRRQQYWLEVFFDGLFKINKFSILERSDRNHFKKQQRPLLYFIRMGHW